MTKYLVTLSPEENIYIIHDKYSVSSEGRLKFINRIVEFKNELPTKEELESLTKQDTGHKDDRGREIYKYYSIIFMQKLM